MSQGDVTPIRERTYDDLREALERIAFHEPQDDDRAEAMRRIAREALGMPTC
jgi:hypothetical protein